MRISVKFLLDENVSSILWEAIQRFNEDAAYPLEATRVGDHSELPKGSDDPTVLRWAEQHGYILVSHDKKTLPDFLAFHLANDHHLPGLFLIRNYASSGEVIELLAVAAMSDDPMEWQDQILYLP